MNRFKIYCNAKFNDEAMNLLRAGTAHHALHEAASAQAINIAAGEADPALFEADIAFGQPDVGQCTSSQRLRWIHLTSAGYERYATPSLFEALKARGAALTNSSSVFDEPVAEHTLAMMLALARNLPWAILNQHGQRAWRYGETRQATRMLQGQTVVMLGYGAIVRRLVELLAPFDVRVIAVRRSVTGDEVIETLPTERLHEALRQADHVVNALPGGDGTRQFVDAAAIAAMPADAVFYNVGRGSTVDQAALIEALTNKRLRAAYLDVMTPEPLPPDHALWDCPNCHITTHIAGGHSSEAVRLVNHFVTNLRAFESGGALNDRIV